MNPKTTDVKLLWGRSASRCAICRCELSDRTVAGSAFTLGEQAHIVAEEEGGPRGHSSLTREERNAYHNLVLLCPTHHTLVDKNVEDYPIEKLHMLKTNHELWVQSTLTPQPGGTSAQAADIVYSTAIDRAVAGCALDDWYGWTSFCYGPDSRWRQERVYRAHEFREQILAAIWPGTHKELERALQTLAFVVHEASRLFLAHSDLRNEVYHTDRFYRRAGDRYHVALRVFEDWQSACDELIVEATKAANWFADVVRRDLYPAFFAAEGRFLLQMSNGLSNATALLLYTEAECAAQPEAIVKHVEEVRRRLDIS